MLESNHQFDTQALKERLFNDSDLIKEIAGIFLEDTPQHIHELKTFIETNNLEKAREVAHKIKGAAANMSAESLHSLAREIEFSSQKGEVTTLNNDVAELESLYLLLEKDLINFLHRL